MTEKKEFKGWLFLCYIQSERRFVVHTLSISSFYTAMQEHAALFPSHNVIFSLQVPLYLAEFVSKQLQVSFADSECIYSEFSRCVSTPMQSLIVSQIRTYQGLIPLTYSDVSRKFSLSVWSGDYYQSAQAFVLHVSLIEFFNSVFFVNSINALNLFTNV